MSDDQQTAELLRENDRLKKRNAALKKSLAATKKKIAFEHEQYEKALMDNAKLAIGMT